MSYFSPEKLSLGADSIAIFSPAKVNLFFRVLKKREDGYHEIASLYQAISLGDTLFGAFSDQDSFTCCDSSLENSDNLVIKARDLFRQKSGKLDPIQLHLVKRIPTQAGLGGGSGNAASTLWLLNKLYNHLLSMDELISLAERLGSDVPFFFSHGSAYCRGRGEILKNLPCSYSNFSLWIAKPKEKLLTSQVYSQCRPEEIKSMDPEEALSRGYFFNDLEIAAFQLLPKLAIIKEQIQNLGFSQVVMTGSGTAFFCLGNVPEPRLDDVTFFPVECIARDEGKWYEPPKYLRI